MKLLPIFILFTLPLVPQVQASGSSGGSSGGGSGGSSGGRIIGGGTRSGGGSFSKPKPKTVDKTKFNEGMAVFENKFDGSSTLSSSSKRTQARNLLKLQNLLAKESKSAAAKLDIEGIAEKLTSNDLRNLRYYLDVKYLESGKYNTGKKKKAKK